MNTAPTRAALEQAFARLAFKGVQTLDEALAVPMYASLIRSCAAWQIRRDRADAQAARGRRVVRPAEQTPSPSRTWWHRPPAVQPVTTDLKRAAAGDRDD